MCVPMASTLLCFGGFLFLCTFFWNVAQGRGPQIIDGPKKNGNVLYEPTSKEAASEHAFGSRVGGYREEIERRKIYNKSYDLAWEKAIISGFNHPDDAANYVVHWALLYTNPGKYYSAKATLNVYGLSQVANNQESASSIWVMNLGDGQLQNENVIQAGWHVNPELYGDTDTHFFVRWTEDDAKKGCYNLLCEGFKLDKSSSFIPGAKIRPLSIYNGEQYVITLKISKDQQTGDWWLHHDDEKPVGYWPKSLFTGLQDSATHVEYGGVVVFVKNEKSPPMGSGHFPSEGERKAASISNIELDGKPYDPTDDNFLYAETQKNCYLIGGYEKLYFGGPGGCFD